MTPTHRPGSTRWKTTTPGGSADLSEFGDHDVEGTEPRSMRSRARVGTDTDRDLAGTAAPIAVEDRAATRLAEMPILPGCPNEMFNQPGDDARDVRMTVPLSHLWNAMRGSQARRRIVGTARREGGLGVFATGAAEQGVRRPTGTWATATHRIARAHRANERPAGNDPGRPWSSTKRAFSAGAAGRPAAPSWPARAPRCPSTGGSTAPASWRLPGSGRRWSGSPSRSAAR